MRAFTNLTVHPGWQITIDGEAYGCPGFMPPDDLQGATRVVPKDRILAIQWHGEHDHGSIEGFGLMEGFTDKSQLKPYVDAWLAARVAGKTEKLAAMVRLQSLLTEEIATMQESIDSMRGDIRKYEEIGTQEAKERKAHVTKHLTTLDEHLQKSKGRLPTDAQIAAARAELATANQELADAA